MAKGDIFNLLRTVINRTMGGKRDSQDTVTKASTHKLIFVLFKCKQKPRLGQHGFGFKYSLSNVCLGLDRVFYALPGTCKIVCISRSIVHIGKISVALLVKEFRALYGTLISRTP
jgi:hypothetical protein